MRKIGKSMTMSLTGSRGPAGSKIPKGYSAGSLLQYTPEQMDLFKQLFSYVSPGSGLSKMAAGDTSSFEPQEQLAARDFQNFAGQLGSRFAGTQPGEMSSRKSGAFNRFSTQGAQDFALQLASQRQDLQRQALMDLMGISSTLLGQQPYQNFLIQKQQKQPSFWQRLLGGGAPAIGSGIGGLFGGIPGAMLGGGIGSSFSSGFGGY